MKRRNNGSTLFNAYTICKWMADVGAQLPDGRWVPARPLGWTGIQQWKMAWLVLRGRADALIWPGQGDTP